jgi:hypothetical protein
MPEYKLLLPVLASDLGEVEWQKNFSGDVGNHSYEIYISIVSYKGNESDFWGVDGTIPSFILKEMIVNIDDRECQIPEGAVNRLSEINRYHMVKLKKSNGVFFFTVKGGDGAGSFLAKFELIDNILIKRTLISAGGWIEETVCWGQDGTIQSISFKNDYLDKYFKYEK